MDSTDVYAITFTRETIDYGAGGIVTETKVIENDKIRKVNLADGEGALFCLVGVMRAFGLDVGDEIITTIYRNPWSIPSCNALSVSTTQYTQMPRSRQQSGNDALNKTYIDYFGKKVSRDSCNNDRPYCNSGTEGVIWAVIDIFRLFELDIGRNITIKMHKTKSSPKTRSFNDLNADEVQVQVASGRVTL